MGRLWRPHVPLGVKLVVLQRQIAQHGGKLERIGTLTLRDTVDVGKAALASHLGCDYSDLRLDHDPPLGVRPRRRAGLGRKTYYTPDANDPDHLFYRPHGPEHNGSHLIKTNVRGDHGQHPDRVLIKKARRQERSRKGETRRKASGFPKRKTPKWDHPGKRDWPSRPFRRKP